MNKIDELKKEFKNENNYSSEVIEIRRKVMNLFSKDLSVVGNLITKNQISNLIIRECWDEPSVPIGKAFKSLIKDGLLKITDNAYSWVLTEKGYAFLIKS